MSEDAAFAYQAGLLAGKRELRIAALEFAGRELIVAAENRTCPASVPCWCKEDAEARWRKAVVDFNALIVATEGE